MAFKVLNPLKCHYVKIQHGLNVFWCYCFADFFFLISKVIILFVKNILLTNDLKIENSPQIRKNKLN